MGVHVTAASRAADDAGWPPHLRPRALRWARASVHYDATIRFYRDLIGLPVIDAFTASFGEDGTIFGLPDSSVQLEIVRAHADVGTGGALDQLVLYLDDADAVIAGTAPLRAHGCTPDPDPHPYWAANGAVVFQDPDGRRVVFAPWVFGRDPDPINRDPNHSGALAVEGEPSIRIDWYDGDRAALRPLFEAAEDSGTRLAGYLDSGRVLVAVRGPDVVGHLQLVPTGRAGEVELTNMAVVRAMRRMGIGRTLIDDALRACAAEGASRMVVATAAADVANLRFYQRCGFRFTAVERDAFTPATGYPEPILIDGIPLRDRVWLAQDVVPGQSPTSGSSSSGSTPSSSASSSTTTSWTSSSSSRRPSARPSTGRR